MRILAATLVGVIFAQLLPPLQAAEGPATQGAYAPLPEHHAMAREVGVWDAESKLWTTPDAPPIASKGVETVKTLGQLWLVSDYEGEFAGEKFSGKSQMTYDPLKKKYVGTWIDTSSPYLFTLEGDYDVATHTLTMSMEGVDVATGKVVKHKTITRYVDEDAKEFEIHLPVDGQDGKWRKVMEINYKRRK